MVENSSNGELSSLLEQLKAVAADAQKTFGALSQMQINWKPSPDQWSVGQCFEHVMTTNDTYLPVLERVARGEHKTHIWARISPLSGFFGKMAISMLAPEGKRKFKAPSKLQPSSSNIEPGVVAKFAEHQARLASLLEATRGTNLGKVYIMSPVALLVTYSLSDAMLATIAHERRHFEQARRVTCAEGFPSE